MFNALTPYIEEVLQMGQTVAEMCPPGISAETHMSFEINKKLNTVNADNCTFDVTLEVACPFCIQTVHITELKTHLSECGARSVMFTLFSHQKKGEPLAKCCEFQENLSRSHRETRKKPSVIKCPFNGDHYVSRCNLHIHLKTCPYRWPKGLAMEEDCDETGGYAADSENIMDIAKCNSNCSFDTRKRSKRKFRKCNLRIRMKKNEKALEVKEPNNENSSDSE